MGSIFYMLLTQAQVMYMIIVFTPSEMSTPLSISISGMIDGQNYLTGLLFIRQ